LSFFLSFVVFVFRLFFRCQQRSAVLSLAPHQHGIQPAAFGVFGVNDQAVVAKAFSLVPLMLQAAPLITPGCCFTSSASQPVSLQAVDPA
jgi:hypothetical protein